VDKTELVEVVRQKLAEARETAIEAGGSTLFYLIDMALLKAKDVKNKSIGSGSLASEPPARRIGFADNRKSRKAVSIAA